MQSNFLNASKQLHQNNPDYGKASEYSNKNSMKSQLTIPAAVHISMKQFGVSSFLDHGTGKGGLVQMLKSTFQSKLDAAGFDPAVPEYCKKPVKKYDIVSSIDVLEHIGIKEIDATLEEIHSLTNKFFFFCIDLVPSTKKTQDKRNAHFLLAPSEWWIQKIKHHFDAITCVEVGELNDGSKYPMHLIGCATNSMRNYNPMCCFLANIKIANMRWVWAPEVGGVKFVPYRD